MRLFNYAVGVNDCKERFDEQRVACVADPLTGRHKKSPVLAQVRVNSGQQDLLISLSRNLELRISRRDSGPRLPKKKVYKDVWPRRPTEAAPTLAHVPFGSAASER
jgi:hypothetical protein